MDKTDFLCDKKISNISCVIMASGEGRRFGGNKMTALLDNKPLVLWAVDTAKSVFEHIVVVTRHTDVAQLCRKNGIDVVLHSFPGRNDTVRLGLEHFADGYDGCIFCQGDQPLISAATLYDMACCFENSRDKIIRLCFDSQPSSPVIFSRRYFDALKNLPADKGGNVVVKSNLDSVLYINARNIYETRDIDTKQDLEEMEKHIKSSK